MFFLTQQNASILQDDDTIRKDIIALETIVDDAKITKLTKRRKGRWLNP